MAAARTTTGCWTCRIRRKKCDDAHPACGPCTVRQVTCHGYGVKPSWMNSAESQKAEVEKIKKAVSQSYKLRRPRRFSERPGRTLPAPMASGVPFPSSNENEFRSETPDLHLTINQDIHTPCTGRAQITSWASGNDNAVGFPLFEPWPKGETQAMQIDPSPELEMPSGKEVGNSFAFHPQTPPADNKHDFEMIMNYLDNVFPLQFYFYQPSNSERGRGWLLYLLLRARSSYFSALTFSVLHQIIFVANDDDVMQQRLSEDLDRYHVLAIGALQEQLDSLPTLSGREHLKVGVEILACTIQLMSIEVFRETKQFKGWKGDWQVHLQAAAALLSVIGTNLPTYTSPSGSSSTTPERDPSPDVSLCDGGSTLWLVALNEIAGLDFFTTCYVWGDVFRCASVGIDESNRDSFPYLKYLEEDRIRLDRVMGCRNWAMVVIRKISSLEAWIIDMQSHHVLSMPILVKKASVLEDCIHSGLKTISNVSNGKITTYEEECNLVSEIYALSALIYLAIVVSGNSHLLPEVRCNVTKALAALKALPPHLLIRVSWAFCAAGCMAGEAEKEEFRNILLCATRDRHPLGTLGNGLEIMEEFWVIRDSLDPAKRSDGCAWKIAMNSLGLKILLI